MVGWGGVGLIETGPGRASGLFNLPKMVVSVLQKDYNAEWKSTRKRSFRSCSSGSNFQLVKKPTWINPHEVIQNP